MIGFGKRVSYAFRCFFSILSEGQIPPDITQELSAPAASQPAVSDAPQAAAAVPKAAEVESPERAVQMLYLLQRDGRFAPRGVVDEEQRTCDV